jgi:hypothetical protein
MRAAFVAAIVVVSAQHAHAQVGLKSQGPGAVWRPIAPCDAPCWVGIGNTNPLAPVHIGNGTRIDSTDTMVLVNRMIRGTMEADGTAHAFTDASTFYRTGLSAYAAFDAKTELTPRMHHYTGFQSWPVVKGRLTYLNGFNSMPRMDGGSIEFLAGAKADDPEGEGSIGVQYGFLAKKLTRGRQNYAFYSEAPTPSYFGGATQIDGDLDLRAGATVRDNLDVGGAVTTGPQITMRGNHEWPVLEFANSGTGTWRVGPDDSGAFSIGLNGSSLFTVDPAGQSNIAARVATLEENASREYTRTASVEPRVSALEENASRDYTRTASVEPRVSALEENASREYTAATKRQQQFAALQNSAERIETRLHQLEQNAGLGNPDKLELRRAGAWPELCLMRIDAGEWCLGADADSGLHVAINGHVVLRLGANGELAAGNDQAGGEVSQGRLHAIEARTSTKRMLAMAAVLVLWPVLLFGAGLLFLRRRLAAAH